MPDLRLDGCRPRPLISYLKALGVLRVVAEQADPGAALRWHAGAAELRCAFDRDELVGFFLDAYRPTPALSPWNGGSGFFPKDDAKALDAIASADPIRFGVWHAAISVARSALAQLALVEKPTNEVKLALLRRLRASWDDEAIRWLDAAVVLRADGPSFPPLLGTGGNDGRYEIANNYAQSVARALGLASGRSPDRRAEWLKGALFDTSATMVEASLAYFDRQNSPVNTPEGEADGLANPWNLVLAVEGCLVMSASATRRAGGSAGAASAPFTAAPTAAGYGSAVSGEKGRDELWLPMWEAWTTAAELDSVLREGRAQVGRDAARSGLDFARAAAELGVARGISAFERYAVLERAGQAHLALPVGRVEVRSRPEVRLLDRLGHWSARVTHYGTADGPASLRHVARALDRAMFEFARRPYGPAARRLLETVGAAETALAVSVESASGGLRPLVPEPAQPWLELADDASVEFALAACLASLHDKDRSACPAIRDYLHGTIVGEHGRAYDPTRKPLVARSAPPLRRLAALHARRHLDASAGGRERLSFDFGIPCPRRVVAMVTAPNAPLDVERVMRLMLGLTLLDFRAVTWRPRRDTPVLEPLPAHALLALAFAGTAEVPLDPRPGWVALLVAGHTRVVLADARLRLRMLGMEPIPTAADLTLGTPAGLRLAAALLLALSRGDRAVLSRRLLLDSDDGALLTHPQGIPA